LPEGKATSGKTSPLLKENWFLIEGESSRGGTGGLFPLKGKGGPEPVEGRRGRGKKHPPSWSSAAGKKEERLTLHFGHPAEGRIKEAWAVLAVKRGKKGGKKFYLSRKKGKKARQDAVSVSSGHNGKELSPCRSAREGGKGEKG